MADLNIELSYNPYNKKDIILRDLIEALSKKKKKKVGSKKKELSVGMIKTRLGSGVAGTD